MKKLILSLVVVVVILAVSSSSAFAHSGRTDSYGGHTNTSTGVYEIHGL
jgi:hypothetical protein